MQSIYDDEGVMSAINMYIRGLLQKMEVNEGQFAHFKFTIHNLTLNALLIAIVESLQWHHIVIWHFDVIIIL